MTPKTAFLLFAAVIVGEAAIASPASPARGGASDEPSPGAHPGLALLLEKPLSFPVLTLDQLDRLWAVWPDDERARAGALDRDGRRRMAFERYGWIEREGSTEPLPFGYVAAEGNLYPNCLSCHGGRVAGRIVPGLANGFQDLMTLVEDLAALRALESGRDPEAARGSATLGFPLNFTRGLTNATQFSILLGAMRDEHLDLRMSGPSQEFVHHDVDAPAWWQYSRKERIYWDGMAPKTPRTLMQFTMAPGLPGERIRSWEPEFETIEAYIAQLEPPPYPFPVDHDLAQRGRQVFEATCSTCHGTYGEAPEYPSRLVPWETVRTDPVRLDAISDESKRRYNRSWFSGYGQHPVRLGATGYLAPPLDGVWATGPYFHNGSSPTLWHVLHPDQRPEVWRRIDDGSEGGFDRERVGPSIEVRESVPKGIAGAELRSWYDGSLSGHSNQGHRFAEPLSAAERQAVLEYLKTL
ncbi:MAG TPA: cytochrome c [Thermoanaerobaculia bacterium]|nr:cytochrome c [Thermoanaerobaculia bacterium]